MRLHLKVFYLLIVVLMVATGALGQRTITRDRDAPPVQTDARGNPVNPNRSKTDSLKHRDNSEDSITITYRVFDSTRVHYLDSNINDFSRRFPLPYHYVHNGNLGNAASSYIFNPNLQPGFDAGFHAFDIYRFTIEQTRFYQTTRPYTELAYMLGNKAEQMIHAIHTQNKGHNFNFGFEYRFINAPGVLKNQNASHGNFRFHSYYNSNNRKYSLYTILITNRLKSSENAGLRDDTQLKELTFSDPFELQTRLGSSIALRREPFNTKINIGNDYKESNFLIRQQYDLGPRDSLVTDSVTIKLFYPRFRIQHTFQYRKNRYLFQDIQVDSNDYRNFLGFEPDTNNLDYNDRWREINNEVALISFPQKNNLNQFFKVGAAVQDLRGEYAGTIEKLHNVYGLAEYRNRTRNQVWDIEASGKLYINGFNAGDYNLLASIKRLLSRSIGYLELGIQNANRTPPVNLFGKTSHRISTASLFKQENYSRLFAHYDNPRQRLRLSGEYYLVNNYSYFDSFYTARQESTLFNVLHIAAEKSFRIARSIHLHSELHLQQTTANAPVNIPMLFTRNRLAYEGNLGFRNLLLTTGIEMRYNTPYKPANYSPLNAQFTYQDSSTITNYPELHYFLHFRIKTFKAFIRFENLNSLGKNYNFVRDHYPYTPFWTRIGIWWTFVN